jgi:predicted small lipoprotein YifL
MLALLAALLVLGGRMHFGDVWLKAGQGWRSLTIMSNWQFSEPRRLSTGGRTITRRMLLLAVVLASVAACGKKGGLELPPAGDAEDDEEAPGAIENPDTYGDPMTFPEPDAEEESVE